MLVKDATKKGFILAYRGVMDFCKAVEKTQGKSDHVYMCCVEGVLSFYATSPLAVVLARSKVEKGPNFSCGVDAVRFITLFKKLSEEGDITLTPAKASVLIEQDNISVKFPVVDYVKEMNLPNFIPVSGGAALIFASDVGRCLESIGTTQRFPGVLVDNTQGNVTRSTKFSDTAIRTSVLPKLTEIGDKRLVIPPEMAKALSFFEDEIEQVLFGENTFGVQLRSGTLFYMPLLNDSYPTEYVSVFGLTNEIVQVQKCRRTYVFEKERLQNVIDLVSSVVGAEESQVQMDIVGVEEKSGCSVLRISAKSFNGCEAAEHIVAQAPITNGDMASCRVHKTRALSCLKTHGDDIHIHDVDDRVLIVTDGEGADVTVLLKSLA